LVIYCNKLSSKDHSDGKKLRGEVDFRPAFPRNSAKISQQAYDSAVECQTDIFSNFPRLVYEPAENKKEKRHLIVVVLAFRLSQIE
jgi:hypothetical protein